MSTPDGPGGGVPQGWYADPAAPPDRPAQRWWDGTRWTEHVAPQQHPVPSSTPYAPVGKATTTPDGVPLAGWWQRVGASLVDTLVLVIPIGILAFPFIREIGHEYAVYFRDVVDAAEAGRPAPSSTGIYGKVVLPSLGVSAVSLVVQVLYHALMLRWRGATLGKLALGLRVRLREAPGPLSWAVVGKHVAAQFGYGLVTLIPFVGGIAGLYPLLDSLWPLWDDKRQALHDKVAGTNVVRVR